METSTARRVRIREANRLANIRYRATHRAKINDTQRAYRKKHPEVYRGYALNRYYAHREEHILRHKEWHKLNKDHANLSALEYQERTGQSKKYYQENTEHCLLITRLWSERNKKYRQYQKRQYDQSGLWIPMPVVRENYKTLIMLEMKKCKQKK